MKETSQDLTTTSTVALSRREFMRGAGGVTLSLVLSLHGANAGILAQNAPPRPLLGGGGRPPVGSSATNGDLFQLPFWGDSANWNRPEYYDTIQAGRRPYNRTVQSADIDGDGRDELLVRGLRGIFAHRFSPDAGQWIQLPDGPAFDDKDGWNRPQYRQSMQTADIDGDGKAELLSIGYPTLYIVAYDPDPQPPRQPWNYFPPGPALDPNGILEQPPYYQTMQCADIDGDGQAELLVRGPDGLSVWKYDAKAQTWNQESLFSLMSDASGWNQPKYYETIQCADVDGDGKAELLGRGADGMYAWKYDAKTKTFSDSVLGTDLSDSFGWDQPQFYTTIQCADIDGDGQAELLGLVPAPGPYDAGGMNVWKYDSGASKWDKGIAPMRAWQLPVSDLTYETIQFADIDGDGQAELLGRVGTGIQIFKYDPDKGVWNQLPDVSAWSDANGWDQVQFYTTIQTARALKPGDPGYTGDGKHTQSVLIGRASTGMQTYRYDTVAKQWVNSTQPFPSFTGDQLKAYNQLPTTLGISVGSAGVRGTYGSLSSDFQHWMEKLYLPAPSEYSQMPRPHCIPPPPSGVSQADWDAVTWQIYWEMLWVKNVQLWYGPTLSQDLMTQTFLADTMTLPVVGNYLQYTDSTNWTLTLSILALVAGATASALAFPGLGAGVAASMIGILSRVFSAGALPHGGGSYQATYQGLQGDLLNLYTDRKDSLVTILTTITGFTDGGGTYHPGDYGLLKAIGGMIESTIWNWPENTNDLVTEMQRGYALEVFKVLFTAYQVNAGWSSMWSAEYYPDSHGDYPGDYPVKSSVYVDDEGIHLWLVQGSGYPPEATLRAMFDPPTEHIFPVGISTSDFYQAQNGWPTFDQGPYLGSPPPRSPLRPPSLGPDLRVSATLTRDPATNQIVATLTVKNMGAGGATNVEIVETSLNRKPPLGNLSRHRTHLTQGRSEVYTVIFPSLAPGATAILKVSGRYKGGTFGGSFRIKIP